MLDPDDIDLDDLVLARNDAHPESIWYFDPSTGRCLFFGPDDGAELAEIEEAGDLIVVHHEPQPTLDVHDFIDAQPGPIAAKLHDAFHQRRGWRRFRDRVHDLGREWGAFTAARERHRALAWLAERGLVDPSVVADQLPPVRGSAPDEETMMHLPVETRFAHFADDGPALPVGYLLVVGGPSRGEGLLVEETPVVIGRSLEADLTLADEAASRQHVQLDGMAQHLVVTDLDSRNGTLLNGHAIAGPLHVRDGDLLTLGSSVVLVKTFT